MTSGETRSPSSFPKPRYGRAFGAAWVLYMVAAFSESYDGILTWIGQPVLGTVFAGIAVGLVALLGLVLRVPSIG